MTALVPPRCAAPGCVSPGVVTVSVSSVRVSFRLDHVGLPSWAEAVRCWSCAGAELDRLVTSVVSVEVTS